MSDADAFKDLPWKAWKLNDFAPPSAKIVEAEFQPVQFDPIAVLESPELQQELDALRQQAQSEGYAAGMQQGQKEGYDTGYQAGYKIGEQQGQAESQQKQNQLTDQWKTLIGDFQETLDSLDSVIASRLMQMALTVAKQIIGQAPICDGSALLAQVQRLIQQEPILSGNPQLRVSPHDFDRVEQQLGSTLSQHGWRLLADSEIHAGGCKVSAEDGDIDATLSTRWLELCRLAAPGELE